MTFTHPDLLAGLVRCGAEPGTCDAPLTTSISGTTRVYACTCGRLRVDAAAVEETVAARTLARLAVPAMRTRLEDCEHDLDASPAGLVTWWVDADPTQRRSMLDLMVGQAIIHSDPPEAPGAVTLIWR